ncbi:MAG: chromate efflux transporter [Pseudohongiella sp.]|nr:chromate efflux transporter [Pseudohongiella sp.]MDP2128805.1 chromate efflux transporter [Pseudohongiella sp.]
MAESAGRTIPFSDALAVWWRIGLLSFGGPAGQIALMHRVLVEEKKWLDENRFLHALNYCMLLPGPEAQQLATYIGWLLHGVKGGLVAGLLFILPGALAILALSWLYVLLGDLTIVDGLFFGLKAAVLALVVQALIRIAARTLKGRLKPLLAVLAFCALFILGLPFPAVVIGAGFIGWLFEKYLPEDAPGHGGTAGTVSDSASDSLLQVSAADIGSARKAAIVCALLWALTLGGLMVLPDNGHVFADIAVFFSKMAVVTFGGAYAVLAYVAQQGVEQYQWLQPGEMLDGLGLAETTPGPLILVTQFVGFLGAYRQAGVEPSLLMGTMGALLTTWVTFLPCFVWIFAGAPYVESLRDNRALSAALSAITAAVVGVIANLALWFALNLLFSETRQITGAGLDILLPVVSSIQLTAVGLSALAFVLVFALKWHLLRVLGTMALAGVIAQFLLV